MLIAVVLITLGRIRNFNFIFSNSFLSIKRKKYVLILKQNKLNIQTNKREKKRVFGGVLPTFVFCCFLSYASCHIAAPTGAL
jgi:hypothetical protein